MKDILVKRAKSWTYRLGALVGVLGIVEANFHLIADSLGSKAGLVNLGIMVAIFLAREVTTIALSEK